MDSSYIDKLVDPKNSNDLCPVPLACQHGFVHRPAKVLQTLRAFEGIDDSAFAGKFVRQMCDGQKDHEGNDVSGFFVVADVVALLLFATLAGARQWVNNIKNVNKNIANSLTNVESGNSSVSYFVVDSNIVPLKLLIVCVWDIYLYPSI